MEKENKLYIFQKCFKKQLLVEETGFIINIIKHIKNNGFFSKNPVCTCISNPSSLEIILLVLLTWYMSVSFLLGPRGGRVGITRIK